VKRFVVVPLVIVAALATSLVVRHVVEKHPEPLVIVHWSNSHLMRHGLLPEMAETFNRRHHKTSTGRPIEVEVVTCDSKPQTEDLLSRVNGFGRSGDGCGTKDAPAAAPTIVTPQSDDWLTQINTGAGHDVIDIATTLSIAETWLGIVTYRDMADCLGWHDKQLGYADIVALKTDPDGWASRGSCAKTSWGKPPLLAFTNPKYSTSGRNVLVSLYSMAAHKEPADLTVADIERPEVKASVQQFNQLVDHYMPTTLALNTKISQGQKYGHFFPMPEDNLVSLYLGNDNAIAADGTVQPVAPNHDLVMIYPKEGSVLNAHPAAVVRASWVTSEQSAAAQIWIDYLRSEDQQKTFGQAGFRPPKDTGISVDAAQFSQWGLDPNAPAATIEPGTLHPEVLKEIIDSWEAVKNPAIVTFVADVSASMAVNHRLDHVKDGLLDVIDSLSSSTNPGSGDQVGLVTFSDGVDVKVSPQPLEKDRFEISDALSSLKPQGNTALYDAIARGVELTDATAGDDRAKRAVVVLSDGKATSGRCLNDLVQMMSQQSEAEVDFCALNGGSPSVPLDDIVGHGLAMATQHDVQVFFVGFGDSNIAIGRILAEATGAEYVGSTDEDLANVIGELSGYF